MSPAQFEIFKREQSRVRYMDTRLVEELFPDIEKIEVSYHLYHGSFTGPKNVDGSRFYKPHDMAIFYIDCLNKECSSEGFNLKSEIYSMWREHLAEKTDAMRCDGQEAPDHPEQSCDGSLKYTIKITYKE